MAVVGSNLFDHGGLKSALQGSKATIFCEVDFNLLGGLRYFVGPNLFGQVDCRSRLSFMSYDALRTGRYSSPGQIYMLTTVTHARQVLFLDFRIARCVIAELRHAHDTGSVNSLAWVLMPDHLHWLIQLGDSDTLAEVMKKVKGRTAQAIKRLEPQR